jgi:methylmalonyl-CoA/ethylmalonyl-CoA epimerase
MNFENCVLDHIAIAVNSLEEAKKTYEDLGFTFHEEVEVVESQKVKTQFAQVDEHSRIELLEPTSEESTIHQYIQKKGQGIHHLCFKVPDVKAKQSELVEKGYKMIYPDPVEGAGNCLVNFVHPKSTGGVLIEISQHLG